MKRFFAYTFLLTGVTFLISIFPTFEQFDISVIQKIGLAVLCYILIYFGVKLSTYNSDKGKFDALAGIFMFLLFALSWSVESDIHNHWGWVIFGCFIIVYFLGNTQISYSKKDKRFISKDVSNGVVKNGFEYEEWCANYLRTHGYHDVVVTPGSGDYGADVIGYDHYNNKWVFQCKLYTGKVSNTAVQEVVAAKAHYQANKGAVMTNSQLTDNARKLAWENDIELFEMID